MTSPRDPAAQTRAVPGVHLSIDEATVLLGLLDLLQPPSSSEPALLELVTNTRGRLATAITSTITRFDGSGGIHLV